ncbi:MAG: hypothetical protein ABI904_11860 [Chloroflexota bacterium]
MKKHLLYILLIIGTLIFSACAASPTALPTINPNDVQSTAFAAASTLVAETQAAIPTVTPIPPTETLTPTSLPTNTAIVLATETSISLLPTTTEITSSLPTIAPTASNPDECNKPISSYSGPGTTIRVDNRTGLSIAVWFQVVKTAFGDCGYVVIPPLAAGADFSFKVPQSCYATGAYTTGEKKITFDNVQYPICANNPDKWTLVIKKDFTSLESP